ncbi:hypothetical protein [Myroides odoratus]|uniref:hypothetical protein n=1 Tax=Myroides odoratus TaxID=256 RepID=UPI0039AF9BBC
MKNTSTNKETKSAEETVNKISPLHLAKLQESNQKLLSIDQLAAEIYQCEFDIKQAKAKLDNMNIEVINESTKLNNELMQTYGNVSINPMTGEFQNME